MTVIFSSTLMTYAARHRVGTCRASQSRFFFSAARSFPCGSCRASSGRGGDLAASGTSVRRASPSTQGSCSGGGGQGGVHGEVAAGIGGAPPSVRRDYRRDAQRNRQASLVGCAEAKGRAWLRADPQLAMKFGWSNARIACCRKNLPKPISYWCRSVSRQRSGI